MPTTSPSLFAENFLPDLLLHVGTTVVSNFWLLITMLWAAYWPYIVVFFGVWVVWEVLTRNGGMHYNSLNGFSPTFNRVVGGGTYLLLQTLVFLAVDLISGTDAYYHWWPYPAHLVVFWSTGGLLHLVGFWPEWRV